MKTLLRGLLVLLLLAVAVPVGFAAPSVTVSSVAGFDGKAKMGKWVPVEVTIQNEGAEFEGVIRFSLDATFGGPGSHKGVYETPVAVPAGTTKRVQVEVPSDLAGTPLLKLVSGGETVAEIPYQLDVGDRWLVGVLGVQPEELTGLAGKEVGGKPIRLARLDPDRMPADPLLLESLDAVLLDRFTYAELPEPRRQALQAWVEQGGVLIAAAGPEAKRLDGLSPWVPLTFRGLETVKFAGVGTAPISQADPAGGWTAGPQIGDQVLAWQMQKGQGSVHLLTFDPALEPFASWSGLPGLVGAMFRSQQPSAMMGPAGMGKGNMSLVDSLNQFPLRELPSSKALLILLGAYALVIGPVHLLLLRGFRRLGWALLSLPVLIAAGGLGIWAYTKKAHASDIMVSTVAVMEGQSGGSSMRVNLLAGFFVPPGSTHRVAVGDALLTPVPPTYVARPDREGFMPNLESTFTQSRVARLGAKEQWGMQAVGAEAVIPAAGAISGELTVNSLKMTGRLTSHLPFKLEDVIVASGTRFANVGNLGPGDSVDVELVTPVFTQEFGGPNPLGEVVQRAFQFQGDPMRSPKEYERMQRQQLGWGAAMSVSWANSAKQPPAMIVGWTDYQALPVRVDGRDVAAGTRALYVQTLPVGISSGEFALPSSMIPGRVLDYNGMARDTLQHPGWNLAKGESVTFEFDVPVQVIDRVTEMEVRIQPMGGRPGGEHPLEYSIWRWSDSTWHKVEDGRPINDVSFISPYGKVRVKAVQRSAERMPLGRPGLTVRGRGVKP